METKSENTETTKVVESKEDKREFINIAVSKEQKIAISKEAITKCGISVSEYCRTKILTPKSENQETVINTVNDEERDLYEDRMKIDSETIKALTEENVKLKVSKSIPTIENLEEVKTEEKPLISESAILIDLTPEQRTIVDLAIKYESESFFGTEYLDVNHFIKRKLGDLISSNQGSFSEDYHEKGKPEYQSAVDFIQYLKQKPENGI